MRFPKSFRSQRDDAKRGNAFVHAMYGDGAPPQIVYADKPKRAAPVRNTERVSEADVNKMVSRFSLDSKRVTLYRNNRGEIELPNGRLRYGVGPPGASDWIGYRKIIITQEMVGTVLAQFCVAEAKAPDNPRVEDHQQAFLRAINAAGGIGIVVRDKADLEKL